MDKEALFSDVYQESMRGKKFRPSYANEMVNYDDFYRARFGQVPEPACRKSGWLALALNHLQKWSRIFF